MGILHPLGAIWRNKLLARSPFLCSAGRELARSSVAPSVGGTPTRACGERLRVAAACRRVKTIGNRRLPAQAARSSLRGAGFGKLSLPRAFPIGRTAAKIPANPGKNFPSKMKGRITHETQNTNKAFAVPHAGTVHGHLHVLRPDADGKCCGRHL